jgi:urease alpha subunit
MTEEQMQEALRSGVASMQKPGGLTGAASGAAAAAGAPANMSQAMAAAEQMR